MVTEALHAWWLLLGALGARVWLPLWLGPGTLAPTPGQVRRVPACLASITGLGMELGASPACMVFTGHVGMHCDQVPYVSACVSGEDVK